MQKKIMWIRESVIEVNAAQLTILFRVVHLYSTGALSMSRFVIGNVNVYIEAQIN